MPNPTFPSEALSHGKGSPQFAYIYDASGAEWRPMVPGDFIGASCNTFTTTPPTASGYRNVNLSGLPVSVNDYATKLVGFFADNELNDEPLYLQFYSYPYTGGLPVQTYPLYAQSSIDKDFTYSIDGFQGIVAKVSTDRDGCYPWAGNAGVGILANIYYRA